MWSEQWLFTINFANKSIRNQFIIYYYFFNTKSLAVANQIHTKKYIYIYSLLIIYSIFFFFLKSATVIVDIFSYYLSFNFSGYPSQNFVFEISFGEYSFTIFKTSRLSLCFEDNHRQGFLRKKKWRKCICDYNLKK